MTLERGNSVYDGVVEIDGVICCEGCRKSKVKSKMMMHVDFTDKFMSSYECECGNQYTITTRREDDPYGMWEDGY